MSILFVAILIGDIIDQSLNARRQLSFVVVFEINRSF